MGNPLTLPCLNLGGRGSLHLPGSVWGLDRWYRDLLTGYLFKIDLTWKMNVPNELILYVA